MTKNTSTTIRVSDLSRDQHTYCLYEEVPVAIFINGRHATTVLLAPGDPKAYVCGYLFTEQFIKKPDEIESVRVEKNRVSVITTNIFTSPGPKKTILSGCGGAVSYIDETKLPHITSDLSFELSSVITTIQRISSGEKEECEGDLFSALLCRGEEIAASVSDIGPDQVIDRLIGTAITGKIPFSDAYCIFSGCITSETVRKCLIAKIPLIVTTGQITGLALDIAEKTGLSVLLFTGKEIVFCANPDRVVQP